MTNLLHPRGSSVCQHSISELTTTSDKFRPSDDPRLQQKQLRHDAETDQTKESGSGQKGTSRGRGCVRLSPRALRGNRAAPNSTWRRPPALTPHASAPLQLALRAVQFRLGRLALRPPPPPREPQVPKLKRRRTACGAGAGGGRASTPARRPRRVKSSASQAPSRRGRAGQGRAGRGPRR